MSKAKIEIERLIAAAQKTREAIKEETHQRIETLEIQRQKYLFEAKHECMIEVADAIVEGVAKAAAIDKGNMLSGSLRDKIQKFMDRIQNSMEEIEVMILTHGDLNESEEGCYNIKDLKYWKARLQNNIKKIIDIYEKPRDPNKNALISESEHAQLQKDIGGEVIAKAHFFQGIKRVEDKEINKFFDRKMQETEGDLAKTLRQIDADLAEQIGGLILSPVTAEVANINLNADSNVSDKNAECQDLTLVGDGSLEPA